MVYAHPSALGRISELEEQSANLQAEEMGNTASETSVAAVLPPRPLPAPASVLEIIGCVFSRWETVLQRAHSCHVDIFILKIAVRRSANLQQIERSRSFGMRTGKEYEITVFESSERDGRLGSWGDILEIRKGSDIEPLYSYVALPRSCWFVGRSNILHQQQKLFRGEWYELSIRRSFNDVV